MTAVRRRAAVRQVKGYEFSLDSHSKDSSLRSDSVKTDEFQQPVRLSRKRYFMIENIENLILEC